MFSYKVFVYFMGKKYEFSNLEKTDVHIPEYNILIYDTKLGNNVKISNNVNIYGAEIGDNTVIGSFVEIRSGVKIGKNCVIESFCALVEGITVGDNVYIGPASYITNDMFPKSCDEKGEQVNAYEILKTHIPDDVHISGGVLIRGGVKIGRGAYIGPGSVVVKDVPEFFECRIDEITKKEDLDESYICTRETSQD